MPRHDLVTFMGSRSPRLSFEYGIAASSSVISASRHARQGLVP